MAPKRAGSDREGEVPLAGWAARRVGGGTDDACGAAGFGLQGFDAVVRARATWRFGYVGGLLGQGAAGAGVVRIVSGVVSVSQRPRARQRQADEHTDRPHSTSQLHGLVIPRPSLRDKQGTSR